MHFFVLFGTNLAPYCNGGICEEFSHQHQHRKTPYSIPNLHPFGQNKMQFKAHFGWKCIYFFQLTFSDIKSV